MSAGSVYDAYKPPAPGTMLKLKSHYLDSDISELQQIVVLAGDDYAVFANLTDGDFGGPMDLFIEYSGLYWQDCTQPQLSDYQRGKLRSMWPIREGASTTLPFQGNLESPLTVKITEKAARNHATLGTVEVVRVANSYESVDYSDFAPRLGLSLRIDWGEPGTDANVGYDELVSIDTVDLSTVTNLVEMAKKECVPES